MKKYIYTLYGRVVIMMLAVVIASVHNIYVGRKANAQPQTHASVSSLPTSVSDSLSQRFSFR